MINSKWLFPIRFGIPLALCAGMLASFATLRSQDYLRYRLFYTADLLLIRHIDVYALWCIAGLFAMVLAFSLTGRLPWKTRLIANVLLTLGLAASLSFTGYLHLIDQQLRFVLADLQASVDRGWYLATTIVILGWLTSSAWKHWRFHRRQENRAACQSLSGTILSFPPLNLITVLLILGFMSIHVATGYCWLTTTLALKNKPNVILIMIDTLRADHLGCYGYARNTTPNIDRFARESTLFSQAFSQAPWTVWSVSSFMTSRYPDTMGIGLHGHLDVRFLTLAEVLHDNGYSTNAVISNYLLRPRSNIGQGFDYYNTASSQLMDSTSSPAVTSSVIARLAHLTDRKFFLYMVYVDPHAPYIQHQGLDFHGSPRSVRPVKIAKVPDTSSLRPHSCDKVTDAMAKYDSEIAFTDQYVGQVFAALKRNNLYDDSLIILLSDHGEELMEHGKTGHAKTVFNEVLSVPLIIKFPRQQRSRVVSGAFTLLDLAPSLLGYLHANDRAYPFQGDALMLDYLLRCPEKSIMSSGMPDQFTVRMDQYKYNLYTLTFAQELFNLSKDPWEQQNLINDKSQRGWATILSSQLRERNLIRQHAGNTGLAQNDAGNMGWSVFQQQSHEEPMPLDPEETKKLRTLGYLQ